MSEDKGGEYTKRLSQELKSSLYQRDPEHQMWNGDMAPPDLQVRNRFSTFIRTLILYFILLFSLVRIIFFKFARNVNFQEMLGHVDAMYSQGPPSEPRSYTQSGMIFNSHLFFFICFHV